MRNARRDASPVSGLHLLYRRFPGLPAAPVQSRDPQRNSPARSQHALLTLMRDIRLPLPAGDSPFRRFLDGCPVIGQVETNLGQDGRRNRYLVSILDCRGL
jgi:hypothetical protein